MNIMQLIVSVLYIAVMVLMSIFPPIQEVIIHRDASGIQTSNIVRYEYLLNISAEDIAWNRLALQWLAAIIITVFFMYVFKTKKSDINAQTGGNKRIRIDSPVDKIVQKQISGTK